MGCAVRDCQEGEELKTDTCMVCGKLVHHICTIATFESKDSELNERYSAPVSYIDSVLLSCLREEDVPPKGPITDAKGGISTPTSASTASKRPSSNMWTGSDSEFVLSLDSTEKESCGPAQSATKRPTPAKQQTKLDYSRAAVKGKTKVKPVAVSYNVGALDQDSPSPVSELGVPLSVRHAQKSGTTDGVWDLIHHQDKPYQKRNLWQPSRIIYRNPCLLCCDYASYSKKNDVHNAPLVAKLIETGHKVKYDFDIRSMTRFTVSDTTPSAKNVAGHLGTEQEDCTMHLPNLRISYGIGLKDNIQTSSV
ncbi:hypothetical protein JG687_00002938 [Phytophthora cactorum]|uniref:Uncharacterized protein n=1 Tax=Phytophthora cactorum TaxID=29920 RepID=A0A8T1UU25_9STRA|nr:hypothetical protein JG687_00002938 [Phytophthora cactorum]